MEMQPIRYLFINSEVYTGDIIRQPSSLARSSNPLPPLTTVGFPTLCNMGKSEISSP